MADAVYFTDGTQDVILCNVEEWLEYHIRTKLGNDAARVFLGYIGELKSEIEQLTADVEEASNEYAKQYKLVEHCIEELKNYTLKIQFLKEQILSFEKQIGEAIYDVTDGL